MLTFETFRNQATQIWRDDDIAAHRDRTGLEYRPGDRLLLFPGNLYAACNDDQYRTVIEGRTFTAGSRTNIARPLYALSYVWNNGLLGTLDFASKRIRCDEAFGCVAGIIGIEDVDPYTLRMTLKVFENDWDDKSPQDRRAALGMYAMTELRGWAR